MVEVPDLRTLEVPDWGLESWSRFGFGNWLWYTHDLNFGSLSWFWRCKEHLCILRCYLGLWRMLEVPDWGFESSSWVGYGHWSLIYSWSKFWFSILILKGQRTSISYKSSFGALEFVILMLILIWSMFLDSPMIWILVLYLDFEVAKNINILWVLGWGFGGGWRWLTGVWHLDLDLDMVTGVWYNHDTNLALYFDF